MDRKKLGSSTFILLTALVTVAFIAIVGEYMMAVFWATALAILFNRMYDRILTRTKGKENLAAALTLLFIFFLVIGPLTLIGFAVVNEIANYYNELGGLEEIDIQAQLDSARDLIPWENEWLQRAGITEDKVRQQLTGAVSNVTRIVGERTLGFTQNLLGFFVQFFLMLYVLFFFLRDGKHLVKLLIWVLPLGDRIERRLFERYESVVRATVKGSLVVALIQGTLGGLLFWAVGIPGAVVWGVLMVIASLLPLGNGIIWGPAGVILLLTGSVAKGIVVLAVGMAFIGLIDNLLRPRLVGQDTKMPDYLILLATLGGIAWFGISGFVIGPMIAAFFLTSWEMMGQQFGEGRRPEM